MKFKKKKSPKPPTRLCVQVTNFTNRFVGLWCPSCGSKNDGLTSIVDSEAEVKGPQPGDVTICCYCGSYNIFVTTRQLRRASAVEKEQFQKTRDPRILDAIHSLVKRNMQ